jgi:hypothetical protein
LETQSTTYSSRTVQIFHDEDMLVDKTKAVHFSHDLTIRLHDFVLEMTQIYAFGSCGIGE